MLIEIISQKKRTMVYKCVEEGHPSFREIFHLQNGKIVKIMFDKGHPQHGQIFHHDGELRYKTFETGHRLHKNIVHFQQDGSVCVSFEKGHEKHKQNICIDKNRTTMF